MSSFLLPMAGGLGLFLYGMKLMSDGLEKAAGARLRGILEFFTTNRFSGMLVGIFFTAIIQSSSASTVMVVSFVNAGLMNLSQAAGVILGANIGTTVTSQLVAFNLSDAAPVFLMSGVIMVMFVQNPRIKKAGEVVLGFGVLFTGLTTMSSTMSFLKDSPAVMQALSGLDNHFAAVLIGFVITAVLQSSSVTVSIVLLMASQGLLGLSICFFIILGCNMGSCVSALLASLSGKKNAKRAAVIHFLFNVFGSAAIFTMLSLFLGPITETILHISRGNVGRSVANAHTFFKIFEVLIMFPSTGLIVKLAEKIVPGDEAKPARSDLNFIGEYRSPISAIPQVRQEISRMAELANKNLELAFHAFLNCSTKHLGEIYQREEEIDSLSQKITDFLVNSNLQELPVGDREILGSMFYAVGDIERIGDLAENFADNARSAADHNSRLSKDAKRELVNMYNAVSALLKDAVVIFKEHKKEMIPDFYKHEQAIDAMERRYQKRHLNRMAQGICEPRAGLLFSDMLSSLERIADHGTNVAFSVMDHADEELLTES